MPAGIQAESDRTRTPDEVADTPRTDGTGADEKVSGQLGADVTRAGAMGAGATDWSGRLRTRRDLLRALFTLGVVAGASAAPAPILRARPGAAGAATGGPARHAETEIDGVFDEVYRGRRIQIGRFGTAHPGAVTTVSDGSDASTLSPPSLPDIRIDGRKLQLTRRAGGGYLSVVNHYESFPTPLAAARAAVRDLRGAQLALDGPVHHI
ncbi:tyrosinase family oxidase copper chaperone [Streptomyces sp. NPDC056835]|uniref:tyrosinase family oxidase copper chaperone n=1 Tax=Streptomyces sp. NPDC056835 TaxID=3345956 RepID=UPI00367F75DE